MSEELGKELIVEATKAVAVEGYNDTLKPTLQAVGSIVALPFQAIDAALSKPKLWIEEKRYNFERTKELLAQKMKDTPEELIVPPEPYIAVPVLQYISYCMDNDELRDMYANLLANSMNKVVKNGVHPGFVEIIKQLSPDEAKILKYLYHHTLVPTIGLTVNKNTGGSLKMLEDFINVPELCGCEDINGYKRYIDNLERLGLIVIPDDERLTNKEQYKPLMEHPIVLNKKEKLEKLDTVASVDFIEGHIELTAFGKSFCSICLETRKTIVVDVAGEQNDKL